VGKILGEHGHRASHRCNRGKTDAGVRAGGELTTLAGTVSTTALTGAEDASRVGLIKLGCEGITYAAGLAGCSGGIIE
jgi:hypothetical protein